MGRNSYIRLGVTETLGAPSSLLRILWEVLLSKRYIASSSTSSILMLKKPLQMLANSDVAEDEDLKSIVESTAAVIFLGTPHRGSKDMASVGEIARKAASIICDTSTASLDALGLKTSDLERCQEAFSRLWRAHDFRVKTFQESTGLTSLNVGLLNEKVCPLYLNAVTLGGVLPGPCLLMKPPGCA
jgi:hypothetical protein